MPSPGIDKSDALDAALAASRQSRHERSLRAARKQRIRNAVGLTFSVCIALLALAAHFLAADPEATAIITLIAGLCFGLTVLGWSVGRKQAADAIKEADRSS